MRFATPLIAGALLAALFNAPAPSLAQAPAAQPAAPSVPRPTLDAVRARGHLECGVHLGLPGFSFADNTGNWTGIDVDLCRAIAAAIFGDATKVRYTPTSVQQRWAVLTSNQVDLLSRNSTITFSRDVTLGLDFVGINFYEGQTFIVRRASGVNSVRQMDGATICVAAGSTEERQVQDYFQENNMRLTVINFQRNEDAVAAYDAERCDAYTAGLGALAGQRQRLRAPDQHVILQETISNDPQGPVVRQGDAHWGDLVRWVLNGMIAAEAFGITSQNVEQQRASSRNAEVRRMLGAEGNFGQMLGLSNDWLFNAIKQVGNYGESFERTVGMQSPLRLERGRNQLWLRGGILFTPPFQ
ncbi:MAG: amino acid ABC transporter substrate-binding protein [Alphaproteobacteria bacterium]|nr:amino acid ABC transporter substrate-binding protein [Alphaproteobacteria bacterium]